jgi:ubiquinone/menaquinone biosynthesis C-methylase UbiE
MYKVFYSQNNVEEYEKWFIKNKSAYQAELKAVKELFQSENRTLEIGVGTGRFAVPLNIKIGMEPSPAMGIIAQQRGIEVVEGVAENLPFPDSSFDSLLMVTTICFVDDISKSLEEANRILSNMGSITIGLVDKNSPLGKSYLEKKNISRFYKEANFYSVEEVTAIMKKTGFKEFSYTQTIFSKLEDIEETEPVREGYGEGSFVVIHAKKG